MSKKWIYARHLLVLTALVGLALLGSGGAAAAHNELIGSDPPDGSEVPTGPAQVSLTFNLPVQRGFSTVIVTGPDGIQWQAGAPAEALFEQALGLAPSDGSALLGLMAARLAAQRPAAAEWLNRAGDAALRHVDPAHRVAGVGQARREVAVAAAGVQHPPDRGVGPQVAEEQVEV